ncbi:MULTISPECIES: polyamine ABC transporter substrate-binding protein [Pseudomonas]|jgi:putrescine transport system substrate-binding protein|uniref:Putrescine transport system substrate-binding protein n=1 Tax=Pseudomonas poae TaxID=200451 RepID=A0A7Z1K3Z1_9PSED|nr:MULTISPECIES: polyamine ABC transporter substrate-binding protein [Pseudomonas]KAA8553692.1 Putrescine-binding periplasmic protein SpuD [Pseudomonas marginalis]NMZ90524.1 polyamine ABC transporter substrate-binding protein [Pseudomonas marginalis]PFG71782.1 putrescine transport system substrate-binding protein [Pseudomonas poae]PUB48237.1 putrescine transport system substrate-binding protein [Pseudomonas sp. GV047]TWR73261.1 polyamine ABC transporter substrate-binding protein [Pseudomonas m
MKAIALLPMMLVAAISQAAETVKIYNWSSYIAPDTTKNFQKQTGIGFSYDVYDSNETLDGKLMTGNSGYDVVFPSNHFMARQIQGGALKKLDKSQLPNWKNLNPVLLKALENNDPGNAHGFPYLWGSTGIGYNIDKVKAVLGDNAPVDSWDLIFKPEYMEKLSKCGVAILDNGPELLPIALNYLGLPPHSKNPEDYKKAEALLMKVRPYVAYFHSSKYTGDLANGDICVAVGFSGDVLQAESRAKEAKNGVKIGYEIPKEGAAIWFDMVAMPADAPDEKAGYAFMNYLLEPQVMADITNSVHYANGNRAADSLVDPEIKADTKIYPSDEMMGKLFALEAMPLNIDRIRTRVWNTIRMGR